MYILRRGNQILEAFIMAVTEIKNPTPIEKDIEKAIRERLFNGFNNWKADAIKRHVGKVL